jgi:excinuclease ABC subunit A
LLIEPSAGLHPADVANLLSCCDRLLAAGHSLIVLEHDLDVIGSADHVIDLGPEASPSSERITVAAHGTPEAVAQAADSHTGRFLRTWLDQRALS